MAKIHPTAIVSKNAKLAESVEVGPFCVIAGHVEIGAGTKLISHVVIGDDRTKTIIGENNMFSPGAVIGGAPQDLTYKGEQTELRMGNNNTIREFVSINAGTPKGGGITRIGSNCLMREEGKREKEGRRGEKGGSAKYCQFAGHVTIKDHAKVRGACLFNQFVVVDHTNKVIGVISMHDLIQAGVN